jgi:hypothetical protein
MGRRRRRRFKNWLTVQRNKFIMNNSFDRRSERHDFSFDIYASVI